MKQRMKKIKKQYELLPKQLKASIWFLICSFMQKGISMITTPIFTRLMSASEFGQFGVFNSWYGIVSIIVVLHLSAGVHTQGLVKFNDERDVFSSSLQGLSIILVILWTVIYLIFYKFWNNLFSLSTIQILAILVLTWSTTVFEFWANEQRVTFSYKQLVIVTLIVSIVQPLVGIAFVYYAEDKVTARILSLALVNFIGYSWMCVVQIKKGKALYSKKFWVYALKFNIPLVPHYLSQTVLNSVDRIMIRNMVGNSEAGIYNLAYSISLIMLLFNTSLSQTLNPWMYQKIKEKKGKEIASIAYITLIIIGAVNLILILLAPEAVMIFAPMEYYDAIWVIPPVAMSVFFLYAYDLFAKFAFYYEKTKAIMTASVLGALLNVGLNFLFIRSFGYIAAGYTTLICYMVYSIVHYIFMLKVCRDCCDGEYPYDTAKIAMISLSFLVTGFLLMATYKYSLIRYGFVVISLVVAIFFRKRITIAISEIISLRKMKS